MFKFPYPPRICVTTEDAFDINIVNKDSKS